MEYIGTVAKMFDKHPSDYFTTSWDNMLEYSQKYICKPGELIHRTKASVSWHEAGRNEIVEKAKGEWVLMLDTDHSFAPDLLDRLLFLKQKYNCRVISGIYQYKFPPHAPVVNLWGPNDEVIPVLDWPRDLDIIEVGTIGAGCLLVDREVYREIQRHFHTNPFSIIQGLSEDYSFCRRCKELGIKIHVAPKVECHHMIETVLSVKDYKPTEIRHVVSSQDGIICALK
jgi:hypothetical protein